MIGNRPTYQGEVMTGKLYAWLAIEVPNYIRFERGWRVFEIGVMIPRALPNPGEMMTADHYRGFLWRFAFWLPIDRV